MICKARREALSLKITFYFALTESIFPLTSGREEVFALFLFHLPEAKVPRVLDLASGRLLVDACVIFQTKNVVREYQVSLGR